MLEGTRLRGVGGLCRIRFTLERIKASPEGNRASTPWLLTYRR